MRHKLYLLIVLTLLTACGEQKPSNQSEARIRMEASAQQMLGEARKALSRGDIEAARAAVLRMRHECSLALSAREAGILLMDSIDLQAASQALQEQVATAQGNADSLNARSAIIEDLNQKVRFYRRKLDHDRKNKQTH